MSRSLQARTLLLPPRLSRHRRSGDDGYSLLEVSLTIPILFIIMIGAVDITTTYQAYNAVREGVQSANRCTWSTDGECSTVPTASVVQPAYQWDAWSQSAPTRYVNSARYAALEHHILSPVYRLSNFGGYRLASRTFDYSGHRRRIGIPRLPAEGTRPLIYAARAPEMHVARAAGANPVITATYRNGGGSYPATNVAYSGSADLNSAGTASAIVTFSIPRPAGADNCVQSPNFNSSGPHPFSDSPCNGSYDPDYFDAVLYVEGVRNGGDGSVQMQIEGDNLGSGSEWINLGGRAFTGVSSATATNLCPRTTNSLAGASPPWVTESGAVWNSSTGVWEGGCNVSIPGFYPGFNRLRYGSTYRLRFRVPPTGAGVTPFTWALSNIRIYLPRRIAGWNDFQNCQGGLRPSELLDSNTTCPTTSGLAVKTRPKNSHLYPNNYLSIESEIPVTGVGSFAPAASSTLFPANQNLVEQTLGVSNLSANELLDWHEISTVFETGTTTEPCNQANFGQTITSQPSGNLAQVSVSTGNGINSECSPQQPGGVMGVTPTGGVNYTAELVPLPAISDTFTPPPSNCSTPPNPVSALPPQVSAYKYRSFSVSYERGEPQHLGSETDPREEVVNNPAFNCGGWAAPFTIGFESGMKRYDDTVPTTNVSTSEFFANDQLEYTVGCDDTSRYNTVRSHALVLGLPSNAFMEVETSELHTVATSEAHFQSAASAGCYTDYSLSAPDTHLGSQTGDCSDPLNAAPPALCGTPGVVCLRSVATLCGAGGGSSTGTPVTALEAEARGHFTSRVQTLYPAAQFGCTGANCAQFGAPAGYDPNDPQGLAMWEGSIEVPLMSSNIISMFTGHPVNLFGAGRVSFSVGSGDARTLESEIVR